MRNVVLKSDVDKRLAGIHGELLARLIDDKGGLCGFSTVLQRSSVCVCYVVDVLALVLI